MEHTGPAEFGGNPRKEIQHVVVEHQIALSRKRANAFEHEVGRTKTAVVPAEKCVETIPVVVGNATDVPAEVNELGSPGLLEQRGDIRLKESPQPLDIRMHVRV